MEMNKSTGVDSTNITTEQLEDLNAFIARKAKSLGAQGGKTPLNPNRCQLLEDRLWILAVKAINLHDPTKSPIVPFVKHVVGQNAQREALKIFREQIRQGEDAQGDILLGALVDSGENEISDIMKVDQVCEDPEQVRLRELRRAVREVLSMMPLKESIALASFMYPEMTVQDCATTLKMSRPTFRKFRDEVAVPHFKRLWKGARRRKMKKGDKTM